MTTGSMASKSYFSEISFSVFDGENSTYLDEEEDDGSLYHKTLLFLPVGSVDELASESGRKQAYYAPASNRYGQICIPEGLS